MKHARRGVAVLMVLLLLALTLGLSYAAMRSVSTVGMIQRNCDRRAAARQAALTGLSMGLKTMSTGSWGGVGTSISGVLNTTESYVVSYTSGDARLASSDESQPYRVTVLATGYATDPSQSSSTSSYSVRAIMHFIPRALATEPADWATMTAYTACQTAWGNFTMTVPARIEGPVRVQAIMDFDWDYNWTMAIRNRYHSDLRAMYTAGLGDYRPFTGPVTLLKYIQILGAVDTLSDDLGVTVNNASSDTMSGMTFASTFSKYKLYPGGKEYTVPTLPQWLNEVSYAADPATNPAGFFFRSGSLSVSSNVSIRGTVMTAYGSGGSVYIYGTGVTLKAVDLPALLGTTGSVQLPVAAASDSFQIGSGASVTINGLVATSADYLVDSDEYADITMTHTGKLIADNFYFNVRTDWNRDLTWWANQYSSFMAQVNATNGIKYFPKWLYTKGGLNPKPLVVIKPSDATVQYHWHIPGNTIYTAHASDGGLRWDLVDFKENL